MAFSSFSIFWILWIEHQWPWMNSISVGEDRIFWEYAEEWYRWVIWQKYMSTYCHLIFFIMTILTGISWTIKVVLIFITVIAKDVEYFKKLYSLVIYLSSFENFISASNFMSVFRVLVCMNFYWGIMVQGLGGVYFHKTKNVILHYYVHVPLLISISLIEICF